MERPVIVGILVGVVGGLLLIAILAGTNYGPILLLPDAAIVLTTAVYLRTRRIGMFSQRFLAAFIAFVLANAMSVAYIDAVVNPRPPGWGHVWPVGAMLLIGAVIAAAVARFTAPLSE
jgi:hypothetical protein